MIKISMTTPDVDRVMHQLEYFPEIASKHYRPALKASTDLMDRNIRPNIPVRTGRALNDFKSKVTGRKITTLKGQVGWFGKGAPWYIHFPEGGTVPHTIKPKKRGKVLRFYDTQGASDDYVPFKFARVVHHPGSQAQEFMARGYDRSQGFIQEQMQKAGDAVVKELAK